MNFYVLWLVAFALLWAPELMIAQETAASSPGPATSPGSETSSSGGMGDFWLMFLMPVILVIFLMMIMRPQQKETKERDQMMKELKKNDRIVTVGGVLAKVASINPESKTVKLSLDEKSGSCMTVTTAAIARILTGDEKGEAGETTK